MLKDKLQELQSRAHSLRQQAQAAASDRDAARQQAELQASLFKSEEAAHRETRQKLSETRQAQQQQDQKAVCCGVMILNYDHVLSIGRPPVLQVLHGWAETSVAIPANCPWGVGNIKPWQYNFVQGPSSLGLLQNLGESPLTVHARDLFVAAADEIRQDGPSARSETTITAQIVHNLANAKHKMAGLRYGLREAIGAEM